MKNTKIICTIGPASSTNKVLTDMIKSGMDVARFNMSHGDHNGHKQLIESVREASKQTDKPISIMIDTRGPEIRIKTFKNGYANLRENQQFILTTKDVVGNDGIVSITYSKLPQVVNKGTLIYINDGTICLKTVKTTTTDIETKVVSGGKLTDKKSINIPSVDINMPYISKQDEADIKFACDMNADYLAISFVRSKKDVLAVRRLLEINKKPNIKIISKIESRLGVDNFHEILEVSDGIMVARGDLGVEIDYTQIPMVQKELLSECNEHGKIGITATQMMESMITNSRPTRAEISDVANAILDGSTAIMLSGESSEGLDPANVVRTMARIAEATEKNIAEDNVYNLNKIEKMAYSASATATATNAKAIVCYNLESAYELSTLRPNCPIYYLTQDKQEQTTASLYYGVFALYVKNSPTVQLLFDENILKSSSVIVELKDNVIKVVNL